MINESQLAPRLLRVCFALPVVAAVSLAAAAGTHRMERRFAVSGHPVVTVRNAQGRIEVKSWQKPEVVVVATHSSDKVDVDTEQSGNRIEVRTHLLTENVQSGDLQADYAITVPEESELQLRNDSGSLTVERVFGDMSFDTVASDVRLQEVAGYMVVKTIGGSVVCDQCAGRIEVNSISGNVQLLRPQLDNVRVQTSSGNILFDGDFLRRGIYILRNYSGVIEVRFSENASFDLSATSLHGSVENQATLKPDTHGPRHLPSHFSKGLFGTVKEGHAKVELSSFSGTIKIRKRN